MIHDKKDPKGHGVALAELASIVGDGLPFLFFVILMIGLPILILSMF